MHREKRKKAGIRFGIICIMLSMFTLNTPAQAQSAPNSGEENKDMVFELGRKATSEHYTGDVYISGLLRHTGYDISHLVFEAGSHNDWHIHPDATQVLLILDGEGYYQEEGKPKQLIKKGDVITTLPNVKHWNGATPDSRLVHLSITDRSEKGHIEWCGEVTPEEYQGE